MRLLLTGFFEDLQTVKQKCRKFIENFAKNKLVSPKSMKYALPNSISVLHFDSINDPLSDEYVTVAQLSQRYPAFTQGSIRWLIFNGEKTGFNKVVRKIGRKVILSLNEFKRFVENQIQKD